MPTMNRVTNFHTIESILKHSDYDFVIIGAELFPYY